MANIRIVTLLIAIFLGGCASNYVTPGSGISLAEFTDDNLLEYYEREAVSPFPASVAVVRVQDSNYYANDNNYHQSARYTFITTRDIETDDAIEKFEKLPLVDGVAPLGRLLLPPNADSLEDLRAPAAKLRADMLLIYTVDTRFDVDGKSLGPLSLISLGLIPNKKAHVTATVAGVLVDVRSGYIYGTAEASATEAQSATIWSTELAIDTSRKKAEEQAFESFVDEFGEFWTGVLNAYAATRPASSGGLRSADGYYKVRFDQP